MHVVAAQVIRKVGPFCGCQKGNQYMPVDCQPGRQAACHAVFKPTREAEEVNLPCDAVGTLGHGGLSQESALSQDWLDIQPLVPGPWLSSINVRQLASPDSCVPVTLWSW